MKAAGTEEAKGSYALLICLSSPCGVVLRGESHMLEPGLYAYCGSAMGPGGLKARIARHRRRDKTVHWHVDQVTTRAPVLKVGVSFDLSECDLLGQLLRLPGVCIPVAGFGSSDCRICESHFLKLEDEISFQSLRLQPFEA